jgi:hypothetical protein
MIEELDRHIGVFAERWIADCPIYARTEIAIAEEIVFDHPFDIFRVDVDAKTLGAG